MNIDHERQSTHPVVVASWQLFCHDCGTTTPSRPLMGHDGYECTHCGFVIECDGCGQTWTEDHQCPDNEYLPCGCHYTAQQRPIGNGKTVVCIGCGTEWKTT